jgi:hypothetical protein
VATLLLDAHAAALDPAVREGLARELSRIRDAVEIVASYGGLTPPRRVRIDLKAFVADALAAPARTARLAEPPTVTGDPLDASLDPDLVRAALETAAGSSSAASRGTPTASAVVRGPSGQALRRGRRARPRRHLDGRRRRRPRGRRRSGRTHADRPRGSRAPPSPSPRGASTSDGRRREQSPACASPQLTCAATGAAARGSRAGEGGGAGGAVLRPPTPVSAPGPPPIRPPPRPTRPGSQQVGAFRDDLSP